mmetsp:Transcript_11239/g.19106  ORF Transcript_11239/g.19106 Transcript_11239/m.19106 type:complete len:97 (-) Transcript_11239:346-636(-)
MRKSLKVTKLLGVIGNQFGVCWYFSKLNGLLQSIMVDHVLNGRNYTIVLKCRGKQKKLCSGHREEGAVRQELGNQAVGVTHWEMVPKGADVPCNDL